MGKIILFHGTADKVVVPTYGLGNDKHDYGKGFYLTENIELAKEWAVCRPDETNGYVHKFEIDIDGLRILDFQEKDMKTANEQFKAIGLQRYVEIDWTKRVSRSMWMVQFKTYDITQLNSKPKVDVWRAVMRVGYDNHLRFRKPEDRILNPYGFIVYSYTLSYQGDYRRGPDEVPTNLKYNMMMY